MFFRSLLLFGAGFLSPAWAESVADAPPGGLVDAQNSVAEGHLSEDVTILSAELAEYGSDAARVLLAIENRSSASVLVELEPGFLGVAAKGAPLVFLPQCLQVAPGHQTYEIDAIPLLPEGEKLEQGTSLQLAKSADRGVLAILKALKNLEGPELEKMKPYVERSEDGLHVSDKPEIPEAKAAQFFSWNLSEDGEIKGLFCRQTVALTLYAVTANYTTRDVADWLRKERHFDLQPAIEESYRLEEPIEFLLKNAGLNYLRFGHEHADFQLAHGIERFQQGDFERAERFMRQAAEDSEYAARARYDLGVLFYRTGSYADAADAFLYAAGIDSQFVDAWYNRAAALYRLGDLLGAARAFRSVLELNPDDQEAQMWLQKADPEGVTAPKKRAKKKTKQGRKR